MSGRWTVFALAVGLGAWPALVSAQDHAVPRGGGSGSSSSAGQSHSSGSQGSSGSSSSSSSSSGGSTSSGPSNGAEARHPRAGHGTGWYYDGHHGYYYGAPFYGSAYYYPYFYGSYGYSPYYYSGVYGYDAHADHDHYGEGSALRVIVDPLKTRVYVDGYYAGISDDFDGIFQRLYVPPGRHEISLKLDGYRTQKFRLYAAPGQTLKIHYVMVRGSGENTDELNPGAPEEPPPPDERDREGRDREGYGERPDDRDPGRYEPGEDDRDDADAGTVHLALRPADASVYVDGEFRGSGRRTETLRLAPGRHRLEVVRPGYRTVDREIDVRPGDTTRLDIDLDR